MAYSNYKNYKPGFKHFTPKKPVRSFRDLEVYQKTLECSVLIDKDILSALEKSKYGRIIRDAIKKFNESRSLIPIEMSLYRYLLGKSMLLQHQHPLSVDIILGYMFAKEIEARNLRVIAKGKQLSLPNEFIESQLVV